MYTLYDDQGSMKEGTLKECIVEITNWLSSSDARSIYKETELREAKQLFYKALKDSETQSVEALGFIIEEVEIA